MSRSVRQMCEELVHAAENLQKHASTSDWELAQKYAKDASRAAGQLLQRLTVMLEIEAERA